MQNNTLYLLRGVSGSGKTSLAYTLEFSLEDSKAISADEYFYRSGEYLFDASLLGEAHQQCQLSTKSHMEEDYSNIIVHNTSTSDKEIQPYLDLAEKYNYKVVSLIVENRHGNKSVHSVPDLVLLRQAGKLRESIKLIG